MRTAFIIACVLPLLVLGCKHEPRTASSQLPARTVSDGGYTWTVGGFTMNGTNVAATDLQVRTITNRISQ